MMKSTLMKLVTIGGLFLLVIVPCFYFFSSTAPQISAVQNAKSDSAVRTNHFSTSREADQPVIQLASLSLDTDASSQNLIPDAKKALNKTEESVGLAKTLAEKQKFEEALDVLQNIPAADQNDYAVKFLEARIYSWAGKHNLAEDSFVTLRKQYPEDTDIALSYAYLQFYQSKLNRAEHLFSEILQQHPNYKDAQHGLNRVRDAKAQ